MPCHGWLLLWSYVMSYSSSHIHCIFLRRPGLAKLRRRLMQWPWWQPAMKAYALLMPLLIGNLVKGAYALMVPHACALLVSHFILHNDEWREVCELNWLMFMMLINEVVISYDLILAYYLSYALLYCSISHPFCWYFPYHGKWAGNQE